MDIIPEMAEYAMSFHRPRMDIGSVFRDIIGGNTPRYRGVITFHRNCIMKFITKDDNMYDHVQYFIRVTLYNSKRFPMYTTFFDNSNSKPLTFLPYEIVTYISQWLSVSDIISLSHTHPIYKNLYDEMIHEYCGECIFESNSVVEYQVNNFIFIRSPYMLKHNTKKRTFKKTYMRETYSCTGGTYTVLFRCILILRITTNKRG